MFASIGKKEDEDDVDEEVVCDRERERVHHRHHYDHHLCELLLVDRQSIKPTWWWQSRFWSSCAGSSSWTLIESARSPESTGRSQSISNAPNDQSWNSLALNPVLLFVVWSRKTELKLRFSMIRINIMYPMDESHLMQRMNPHDHFAKIHPSLYRWMNSVGGLILTHSIEEVIHWLRGVHVARWDIP